MTTPAPKKKAGQERRISTYLTRDKQDDREEALKRLKEKTGITSIDTDSRSPTSIAKALRQIKIPTSIKLADAKATLNTVLETLATIMDGFTTDRREDAEEMQVDRQEGEAQTEHPVSSAPTETETHLTDLVQKLARDLKEDLMGELTKLVAVKPTPTSYRDALTRTSGTTSMTTPSHPSQSPIDPRTLARITLQRRKFYARIGEGSTIRTWRREDLIPKANDALQRVLDRLSPEDASVAETHKKSAYFTAISVLRADSILFEMSNEKARDWLFSNDLRVLQAWIHELGDPTLEPLRPTYTVIAFNVPLSHDVDKNTEIEEVNELCPGAISRGIWAKNPKFRSPQQLNGHLLLEFVSASDANKACLEGLIICSKRVTVEKRRNEPPRCRKCNKHGHYVGSCREITDAICATCGEGHATATCTSSRRFCSNCREKGHAAWDRNCPTFLAKCAEHAARNPENAMPYFVTDDLWTHASAPPSEKPAPSFIDRAMRPARKTAKPAPLVQTTLPWADALRPIESWADEMNTQHATWDDVDPTTAPRRSSSPAPHHHSRPASRSPTSPTTPNTLGSSPDKH